QRFFQYRQGPAPVKDLLRRQIRRGHLQVALLGLGFVERNERLPAAALFRSCPIPFVGKVMIERCQQERPELSLFAAHFVERIKAEQSDEETLRQVLGIVRAIAPSANETV